MPYFTTAFLIFSDYLECTSQNTIQQIIAFCSVLEWMVTLSGPSDTEVQMNGSKMPVCRNQQEAGIKARQPTWLAHIKRVKTNTDIILRINTTAQRPSIIHWKKNPHHRISLQSSCVSRTQTRLTYSSSPYFPSWKGDRTKQKPLLLENFKHLALFGLSSGNGSQLRSTPNAVAAGLARPGRKAFLPGHT